MGEYATSYLFTKKAVVQKSKINKLESSFPNNMLADSIKTEKERYFREVTDKPEFDQALEHLLQSVEAHGSDADVETINAIKRKKKSGNLEYSDLGNLESTVNRNFKYFFKIEPEAKSTRDPSLLGVVLIAAAIILRVVYECGESNTLVLFLALINFTAICYTLTCIKDQVSSNVAHWLKTNNFPSLLQEKLLDKVRGKMSTALVISLLSIIALGIISFLADLFSLGNDIISILTLGISILTKQIVDTLTRHYEKRMYHNN